MALKNASDGQRESFGRLSELFVPREIRFTLIGAAALREHGLIRLTDDLDIVVDPYAKAVPILAASSEFVVLPESEDWTSRTCTQRHVKTGVMIDFLTGGIRI